MSRQARRPRFSEYSAEQQRVRRYLELYASYNNRMRLLLERRSGYEESVYSIQSPVISDMPRANALPKDLSSKLIGMLSITHEIDSEVEDLAYFMYQIRAKISEVVNPGERTALELKYIDGLLFKEMVVQMGINGTKVTSLLNRGLSHITVSEKEYERAILRKREKNREN